MKDKFIEDIRKHKMEDLTAGDRASAVMIPLIPDENDETGWSILFQVRAEGIGQAGEICFPGGMIEEGESGEEAAVREATEELLIETDTVEILAPVVTQFGPKNRVVRSYVGILHDFQMTYSEDEVARLFTLPLSWLMKQDPVRAEYRMKLETADNFPHDLLPGGENYKFASPKSEFYFYETEEGVIWGITAEILKEFLRIARG